MQVLERKTPNKAILNPPWSDQGVRAKQGPVHATSVFPTDQSEWRKGCLLLRTMIVEQPGISEKLDTFNHLRAGYLRSPVIGTKETLAVEMDEMAGCIGAPNFGFP